MESRNPNHRGYVHLSYTVIKQLSWSWVLSPEVLFVFLSSKASWGALSPPSSATTLATRATQSLAFQPSPEILHWWLCPLCSWESLPSVASYQTAMSSHTLVTRPVPWVASSPPPELFPLKIGLLFSPCFSLCVCVWEREMGELLMYVYMGLGAEVMILAGELIGNKNAKWNVKQIHQNSPQAISKWPQWGLQSATHL